MTSTPGLHGARPSLVVEHVRARAQSGGRGRTAYDGRKLGLVIEGGAMRGVFSAGADIALEMLGLTGVFDEVYGCSAGAINAAYLLAGQAAYGATIYYEDINNRSFINPLRLNKILNLDFLFDEIICRRKPLDVPAVLASPSRLLVSITDAGTGEGLLVDAQEGEFSLLDALRASATHPLLSEHAMRIGGREYFDGGFVSPAPIDAAIERGCTDILVFLTRPAGYIDPPAGFLTRQLFIWKCSRGNRKLIDSGLLMHERENDSRDLALGRRMPARGINIATICPDEPPFSVARTTKDKERLKAAAMDGAQKVLRAFGSDPELVRNLGL